MSDTNQKANLKEMFEKADASNEYTLLNEHLNDIREKLKSKSNPPSKEQIQSAYEFARLLKERMEQKKLGKKNIEDLTKAELGNLSDEFDLYNEIRGAINDAIGLEVNLRLENPIRIRAINDGQSDVPVSLYMTRLENGRYKIRALGYDIMQGVNYKKEVIISDFKEVDSFIDSVNKDINSGIRDTDLEAKYKAEKDADAKMEADRVLAAKELEVPLSKIDSINARSAMKCILNPNFRGNLYAAWRSVGYESDGTFGSTELTQLNRLREMANKDPAFKQKISNLNAKFETEQNNTIQPPIPKTEKSETKVAVFSEVNLNTLKVGDKCIITTDAPVAGTIIEGTVDFMSNDTISLILKNGEKISRPFSSIKKVEKEDVSAVLVSPAPEKKQDEKQPVKDEKKEAKAEEKKSEKKGFTPFKESEVKIDEDKIVLSSDEADAITKLTGLSLEKVNYRSLFSISEKLKTSENITKENLESMGYKPTKGLLSKMLFLSSGFSIDDDEFNQIVEFQKQLKDKTKSRLAGILEYYKYGKTSIDAQKDSEILKSFKKTQVLEYLSNVDSSFSALDKKTLLDALDSAYKTAGNEKFFSGLKKMIENLGGIQIGKEINSLESLYEAIEANPMIKFGFQKGVNSLGGLTEMYLSNDGDLSDYYKNYNKGLELLNTKIEDAYKVKISELKKSVDKRIDQIKEKIAKKEISEVDGKAAIDRLSFFKEREDKGFFDYFRLRSLDLFGSLVTGKEGGGLMTRIGNDSENPILRLIDIEIGFFSTADGNFLPGIGVSMSGEAKQGIFQEHGTVGVNVYGIYVLAGANMQVNASTIEKASFNYFDESTKRVGIYGNASVGFFGGVTYGAGLYYKESEKEAIEQKEAQLSFILDSFANIKNTQEIDGVKLPDTIEQHEKEMIKADIKKYLIGLSFDKAPDDIKKGLFDNMKNAKLNIFREVAVRMSNERGWSFSGIALGVQFLAGYFPIPVIGVGFEKTYLEKELNRQEELKNKIMALGSTEGTQGEGIEHYSKMCEEAKKRLGIKMEFVTEGKYKGLFKISGYNGEGNIVGTNGNVAVFYPESNQKEIAVVGSDIYVGNVGSFSYQLEKVEGGKMQRLIIGTGDTMLEGKGEKFASNSPTSLITEGVSKKQEAVSEEIENIELNEVLRDFFRANVGLITNRVSVLNSPQCITYTQMLNQMKSRDYFGVRDSLIKLIKLQKKILKGDYNEAISELQNIEDPAEMALAISQAWESIFSTNETKRRIGKIRPAKKGEKSVYKMATTDIDGPGTNRKKAFAKIAQKNLGSNAEAVISKREERVKMDAETYGWEIDREKGKDVFAAVATYRIAYEFKAGKRIGGPKSLGTGLIPMPPGTVSMADGKFLELDNINKSEMYDSIFEQQVYRQHVKNVIAYNLGALDESLANISLTDEQLKELVINPEKGIEISGKKIRLPKAKFIGFMYGECYNESVGIKLGDVELTVPGENQPPKYAKMNLNSYPTTTTSYTPKAGTRNVDFGIAVNGGKKEESKPTTTSGGQTTDPGERPAAGGNGQNTGNTPPASGGNGSGSGRG